MQTLGVFAKYWAEGAVKTRLAAEIGARPAAEFQHAALQAIVARLAMLADQRVLAFTPPEAELSFRQLAAGRFQVRPQAEGDLGQRMQHFFAAELRSFPDARVTLVGADSPTLPRAWIRQAFTLLDTYPVVLGPAEDGGYYLVAARGAVPPIFAGLPWSTPELWNATVSRLAAAGIRYAELPRWYDVDDGAGLERLLVELRDGAAAAPPPEADEEPARGALLEAVQRSLGSQGGATGRRSDTAKRPAPK